MYDPYFGFYPARETSVKNRSGLERHSISTQAPGETPAAPFTCPIGCKKAWEVSPSVLAIYPDTDITQTPLSGLAPVVVPKAPYFAVPANPLLPPRIPRSDLL